MKQIILNLFKIFSFICASELVIFSFFEHLTFNLTISEPRGYYLVYQMNDIKHEDKVLICVEDELSVHIMQKLLQKSKFQYENHLCKHETPDLIKTIAGVPGDKIKITDKGIIINGNLFKNSKSNNIVKNIKLNPQPFNEFTLSAGEYFTLGNTSTSYDSRYYGVIKINQIKGKAILIWKRSKPLLM